MPPAAATLAEALSIVRPELPKASSYPAIQVSTNSTIDHEASITSALKLLPHILISLNITISFEETRSLSMGGKKWSPLLSATYLRGARSITCTLLIMVRSLLCKKRKRKHGLIPFGARCYRSSGNAAQLRLISHCFSDWFASLQLRLICCNREK